MQRKSLFVYSTLPSPLLRDQSEDHVAFVQVVANSSYLDVLTYDVMSCSLFSSPVSGNFACASENEKKGDREANKHPDPDIASCLPARQAENSRSCMPPTDRRDERKIANIPPCLPHKRLLYQVERAQLPAGKQFGTGWLFRCNVGHSPNTPKVSIRSPPLLLPLI
jgi:hypothetical protein